MKVPILIPNIFNHPFTYDSDLKLKAGDYVVVPFGKSELTGVVWDEFEKKTNKNFAIKKVLKKLDIPSLKIEISGHTDNVGSESFNYLLSQQRADAVLTYLLSKGVDNSRITAKGYGKDKPVASNENSEGRAANRRVEIRIIL